MKKKGIYNILIGFGSQFIILALGIIIPRLIMIGYGSETNGLLNTVTQIYTYVALLEAGVGTATIQALYGPIARDNKKSICEILSETKRYYNKISLCYGICVCILSILSPFIIKTELNKGIVSAVVFFNGMVGVITFYYTATLKQLMIAEGNNYIINTITLIIQIITYIAKIILASLKINVVFIQISYFLISVIQVFLYQMYYRKEYYWVKYNKEKNPTVLKQKNYYLIHEITLAIFNSTDTILLSTMCNLLVVSVYSTFNMVFSGIYSLIRTLFNSVQFMLGQSFHKNRKQYIEFQDAFESLYLGFVFSLVSVCYVMILPFIKLYTAGVTDINYLDNKLPLLFCMIQLLSACRTIPSNLINVAQHAKQTVNRSILEAIINLVSSIILVNIIGIYGVLLGTIIALIYRTNDMILYANKVILNRKSIRSYKTVIVNFFCFFMIVTMKQQFQIKVNSYIDFFLKSFVICCGFIIMYLIINVLSNKQCKKYVTYFFKTVR